MDSLKEFSNQNDFIAKYRSPQMRLNADNMDTQANMQTSARTSTQTNMQPSTRSSTQTNARSSTRTSTQPSARTSTRANARPGTQSSTPQYDAQMDTMQYDGRTSASSMPSIKIPSIQSVADNAQSLIPDGFQLDRGISLLPSSMTKAKDNECKQLEKHLYETQNILSSMHAENYTDQVTGDKIANATKAKIWFTNNIVFIIASGAIFDAEDKALTETILNYFNIHENEYLGASAKVFDYKSDLISALEDASALDHGNYHVCVFVINFAEKDDLKNAPEELFNKRGLCEALYEETHIRDEMIRFMTTYGFSKYIPVQPNKANKLDSRSDNVSEETKLQYNATIDYDSPINRELFGNLKTQDTVMGVRTRIKGSVDGIRSHPRSYRNKNTSDRTNDELVKRINSDDYITFNYPTNGVKGANTRISDYTQNALRNKDTQDYYTTKDTYASELSGVRNTDKVIVDSDMSSEASNAFRVFDNDDFTIPTPQGYNSVFSNAMAGQSGEQRQRIRR